MAERNTRVRHTGIEDDLIRQAFQHVMNVRDNARLDDGRGDRHVEKRMKHWRYYIRRLVTEQPFIKHTITGIVKSVNKAAKTCTMVSDGWTEPLNDVKYYPPQGSPQVGGKYTIHMEVKLPTKTVDEDSKLENVEKWIKLFGFVRWLYYRTRGIDTGIDTLWRIKWPPYAVSPEPAPEPQRVGEIPGAFPAGRNGNIGGRRNGVAGGLFGYHAHTRTLWHANTGWTAFGQSGLAPAGTDTHITILHDWGTGQKILKRPGGNIFPISINPDVSNVDFPDRVAMNGWRPISVIVDLGPPELPDIQPYDKFAELIVSMDSGNSWTVVASMDKARIVPDNFRFGFNAFQTYNDPSVPIHHGLTLAEMVDILGPADGVVLPFVVMRADPFIAPPAAGQGRATFNRYIAKMYIWTQQGGLQELAINTPRHKLSFGMVVGFTIRDDGMIDVLIGLPVSEVSEGLVDFPVGYREYITPARRPPNGAFQWGTNFPYNLLRAVSKDGQAIFARDAGIAGLRYASDDYGATWHVPPEPLHSNIDIENDMLIVDIPSSDELAEEIP